MAVNLKHAQQVLPLALALVLVGLLSPLATAATQTEASSAASTTRAQLDELTVSGTDVRLSPRFSPTVKRYAIYRSEATAGITITPTSIGSPDGITVNGLPARSGEPLQIGTPADGETIRIVVTDVENRGRAYELILLPAGFPELKATQFGGAIAPGFLYVSLRPRDRNSSGPFFVAILDNNGVPLYIRETPKQPSDFKIHPNGKLSYAEETEVRFVGPQNTLRIQDSVQVVLNGQLKEVARYGVIGLQQTDAHDFLLLPDGRRVLISYDAEEHNGSTFWDSAIQEIDGSTGKVTFQWRSWDDIPFDERLRDSLEYAHINSVAIDFDGNYIASLRGTSQVVKINSKTGDLIWKLGGVSSDFVIDDPLGGPCAQHTATRLDNGNLMVWDNGTFCPPVDRFPAYAGHTGSSRVAEWRLDEQADPKRATLVWSWSEPGHFSRAMGSAQRLGNGNTLVGWGLVPGSIATEVDAAGNKVYDLDALGDEGWVSYRTQRAVLPAGLTGRTCMGHPATRIGTPGDDRIIGTPGDDVIVGLGGDDVIRSGAGNDLICAGDGEDLVVAGAGNDKVWGNGGNDTIYGRGGADSLYGQAGRDSLRGQAGPDLLLGGTSADELIGGTGFDTGRGGSGSDLCDTERKLRC